MSTTTTTTTTTAHPSRDVQRNGARTSPGRRRCVLSLALALTSVGLLGACSDDDKVAAAACDASVAYNAAMADAPREPDAMKGYAAARLVPIGETLERELRGGARDAAATLRDALAGVAQSGDPATLDAPEVAAARRTIGKAVHDGCGARRVSISAIEYAYTDVPSTMSSGRVSFALRNEGVEEHEMVLFRRAEGTNESLDELLALPQEEAMQKLAFTGVAFGGPRTTDYVAADLAPGTYFLVCFLPQGGTDGPPHFMNGMRSTIVVS